MGGARVLVVANCPGVTSSFLQWSLKALQSSEILASFLILNLKNFWTKSKYLILLSAGDKTDVEGVPIQRNMFWVSLIRRDNWEIELWSRDSPEPDEANTNFWGFNFSEWSEKDYEMSLDDWPLYYFLMLYLLLSLASL